MPRPIPTSDGDCVICAKSCSPTSWCCMCASYVCWSHEPHACVSRPKPLPDARELPLAVRRRRLMRIVELAREGFTNPQIMAALEVSADQVQRALMHPKYGLPIGGRRAARAQAGATS